MRRAWERLKQVYGNGQKSSDFNAFLRFFGFFSARTWFSRNSYLVSNAPFVGQSLSPVFCAINLQTVSGKPKS